MTNCLEKFPWLLAIHPSQGIVGYAYASSYKSRAAYRWTVESSVYVSTSCQRKQVGSKLYKCLFSFLEKMNYHTIYAGVGLPHDTSVEFHKRNGFEVAGVMKSAGYKFGKWLDVMWLQKILPFRESGANNEEDTDSDMPEPLCVSDLTTEEIGYLLENYYK